MLENMRKQGASVFVWVIFGILIAMFVVSFGPQSVGSSQGCTSSGKSTAVEVGDVQVDDSGFRFAYNMARPVEGSRVREGYALEALIRRELLAQEAERRGLRIDDDLIDYAITQGEVHYAGQRIDAKGAFFDEEGQGVFDYKLFKNWLRGRMGVSVGGFKKQQRREMLATTMARILAGSVVASREDALLRFIDERTTVAFDAVRFDPARYGDALIVTDADLERFLAGHEAEVKATYQEGAYKAKAQVRIQRIFVAATPAPALPALPEGTTPPPTPAVDPARAKLVAARADITAGKKKFADVAASMDADPGIRVRRGDWGWYDTAAINLPALNLAAKALPEPALNEAAKTLEVDKVSEVIEAGAGFYLLTVVEKRAGDLTFDQVKRELAEKRARSVWGREAARRAAIEAVTKAQGKNLRDLFKGEDVEKTGAVEGTYRDVPAAWMQEQPAGSGSSDQTPRGVGGSPTSAPAVPTLDAAALMTPSSEVLPPLGMLTPPSVDSFGVQSRSGSRTHLGESAEIARVVFDELATGQVAKRIYEIKSGAIDAAPSYVVLQVTSKQLADVAEFEKNADQNVANLSTELGARYLTDWLRTRCTALVAKGAIKPATDLITPVDDEGRRLPIMYQPCESMQADPGF